MSPGIVERSQLKSRLLLCKLASCSKPNLRLSVISKIDKLRYQRYGERIGIEEHSMNVSLTPELENFVQAKVKSGRYNSASEVVREALRLLEDHETARAAQLEEFRSEIDRRVASLDRGEG